MYDKYITPLHFSKSRCFDVVLGHPPLKTFRATFHKTVFRCGFVVVSMWFRCGFDVVSLSIIITFYLFNKKRFGINK